jgi:uncharacterized protein (DUF111 family)
MSLRGNCNDCDQYCGGFASPDDHGNISVQTLCLFCQHPCGRHQATFLQRQPREIPATQHAVKSDAACGCDDDAEAKLFGEKIESSPSGMTDEALLLTPTTGVALLRVVTNDASGSNSNQQKSMVLRASGYGITSQNTKSIVRVMVGEVDQSTESQYPSSNVVNSCQEGASAFLIDSDLWESDSLTHMETNLDDTTGENLAHTIELLLRNGAVDAWVIPIVMKKGRPAHTLHCLCPCGSRQDEQKAKRLLELIFRHTTTLGVRIYSDLSRCKLCRSFVTVQTPYSDTTRKGLVDVKVGRFKNNDLVSVKAEFDHCKEISNETGVPLKVIAGYAERKVLENVEEEDEVDSLVKEKHVH